MMKKHAIKISLDNRDYHRLLMIMDDMHIQTEATMAKKFLLDQMKEYRQKHPHLMEREALLESVK